MTDLSRWIATRSLHHSQFPPERIAAERCERISVCLPSRETASTIGPIVECLVSLRERGVIDQVVVVDAASSDGTARVAVEAGAEVHQESELLAEAGRPAGKGDAMWRSLSVLDGELVVFLDSDSGEVGEHFACGLLGPLVCVEGVQYVKAAFRRPFRAGNSVVHDGGGRVNELTARPLLNAFYPELAGFRQPLAGEMAGRRDLFERLPFAAGYGVEIALLIDVWREVGLGALAQVDLDERSNAHQPLAALGPMAYSIVQAVCSRLEYEGRLSELPPEVFFAAAGAVLEERAAVALERPPLREWLGRRA